MPQLYRNWVVLDVLLQLDAPRWQCQSGSCNSCKIWRSKGQL